MNIVWKPILILVMFRGNVGNLHQLIKLCIFFIFKFPKHVTQKPRLSLKKTSERLKLLLCSHLQEIVYSGLAKICVHTEESWALKHVRNEVL